MRRLIKRAGYRSRNQFIKRCGFDPQTVYRWETGEFLPKWDAILVMCDALGVSADVLMGRAAEEPTAAPKVFYDWIDSRQPSLPQGVRETLERATFAGGEPDARDYDLLYRTLVKAPPPTAEPQERDEPKSDVRRKFQSKS